jgi:trimethylamine:corrinoid methyltransferase-like protein
MLVNISQQANPKMNDADSIVAPAGRRARGGADVRRAMRTNSAVKHAGYVRRQTKLYEPFTDEQLELIENNAEIVLQETGIDFYEDEEAVQMWKDAGADVKPSPTDPRRFRVRFPKGLVRSLNMCNMRVTLQTVWLSVATIWCLRQFMALLSFATWMKAAAMPRLKISAIL